MMMKVWMVNALFGDPMVIHVVDGRMGHYPHIEQGIT